MRKQHRQGPKILWSWLEKEQKSKSFEIYQAFASNMSRKLSNLWGFLIFHGHLDVCFPTSYMNGSFAAHVLYVYAGEDRNTAHLHRILFNCVIRVKFFRTYFRPNAYPDFSLCALFPTSVRSSIHNCDLMSTCWLVHSWLLSVFI